MITTTSLRVTALVILAVFAGACGGGGIDAGDWKPLWNDDCPTWSSDGSTIAFGRHPSFGEEPAAGVHLYDVERDVLRRLTKDDLTVVAWPAGRREVVAFDGEVLMLVSVRTGRRRPLVDVTTRLPEARDAAVLPSPDFGSVLVGFQRPSATDDPLDYRDEVWVVDVKTAASRMVSRRDQKFAGNASWSPDGRWIAYDDLDHIYLVRRDGSGRRVVPAGKSASRAVFSPDGKALAYTGLSGVLRIDLTTGRRRLLHPGEDEVTDWSRDGRKLLAMSLGGAVVIDSATGRELARLPEFGGTWPGTGVYCPRFSPDGNTVAFQRSWPGSFGGGTDALYLAPADLSSARSIDPAGR